MAPDRCVLLGFPKESAFGSASQAQAPAAPPRSPLTLRHRGPCPARLSSTWTFSLLFLRVHEGGSGFCRDTGRWCVYVLSARRHTLSLSLPQGISS